MAAMMDHEEAHNQPCQQEFQPTSPEQSNSEDNENEARQVLKSLATRNTYLYEQQVAEFKEAMAESAVASQILLESPAQTKTH